MQIACIQIFGSLDENGHLIFRGIVFLCHLFVVEYQLGSMIDAGIQQQFVSELAICFAFAKTKLGTVTGVAEKFKDNVEGK